MHDRRERLTGPNVDQQMDMIEGGLHLDNRDLPARRYLMHCCVHEVVDLSLEGWQSSLGAEPDVVHRHKPHSIATRLRTKAS
jgi:hypothetical protein